ncbi:MAG TPA: ATP-dependent Clp protease proteolytic subunit [Bacteroidales bacterium]|nr:ATP-dependent Clp protease proteolytic subunit [Bacteroidales bacterium]
MSNNMMQELVIPAPQVKNNGRVIYLSGIITEQTALDVNAQLLSFQREDVMSDITLFIDSYGGELFAAFAIVDMMNIITCDVRTICIGKAMSAGQFIFSSGAKGKRQMTKHSRLMIHNPIVGYEGSMPDVEVEVEEMMLNRDMFIQHIANTSNLDFDEIKDLISRNKYLGYEDAIKYGFADSLVTKIR